MGGGTRLTGREGVQARAPMALNTLLQAAHFAMAIQTGQARPEAEGGRWTDDEVPHSTIHLGRLEGGTAKDIVPDKAEPDWNIRDLPGNDGRAEVVALPAGARDLASTCGDPDGGVTHEELQDYPGLSTPADATVGKLG